MSLIERGMNEYFRRLYLQIGTLYLLPEFNKTYSKDNVLKQIVDLRFSFDRKVFEPASDTVRKNRLNWFCNIYSKC